MKKVVIPITSVQINEWETIVNKDGCAYYQCNAYINNQKEQDSIATVFMINRDHINKGNIKVKNYQDQSYYVRYSEAYKDENQNFVFGKIEEHLINDENEMVQLVGQYLNTTPKEYLLKP